MVLVSLQIKMKPWLIIFIYSICSLECSAISNLSHVWANVKKGLNSRFFQHDLSVTTVEDIFEWSTGIRKNVYALIGDEYPFITLTEFQKAGIPKPSDYIGEVWNIIDKRLHLKTEYIKGTTTREFLKVGEADLALQPIAMSSQDYDHYDYSHVVGQIWFHIYRRTKGHVDVSPLLWSENVIYGISVLTVIYTFFQWFLIRSRICLGLDIKMDSKKAARDIKKKQTKETILESSLVISCLNVLGLILQQGSQIKQRCGSARLLGIICTLLGLLLNTAYSAILIAQITSVERYAKIEPLSHLRLDGPYSLCAPTKETSFAFKIMQMYQKSWAHPERRPNWHEHFNRPPCSERFGDHVPAEDYCKHNTYVIDMSHNVAYLRNSNSLKCQVVNDKMKYFQSYLAITLRKNFIHKELINQHLIKLYETGIIKHIRLTYLHSTFEVDEGAILREDYSMTMVQVKILFHFYFISMLFSLCIFHVEITYFYVTRYACIMKDKVVKVIH